MNSGERKNGRHGGDDARPNAESETRDEETEQDGGADSGRRKWRRSPDWRRKKMLKPDDHEDSQLSIYTVYGVDEVQDSVNYF